MKNTKHSDHQSLQQLRALRVLREAALKSVTGGGNAGPPMLPIC